MRGGLATTITITNDNHKKTIIQIHRQESKYKDKYGQKRSEGPDYKLENKYGATVTQIFKNIQTNISTNIQGRWSWF